MLWCWARWVKRLPDPPLPQSIKEYFWLYLVWGCCTWLGGSWLHWISFGIVNLRTLSWVRNLPSRVSVSRTIWSITYKPFLWSYRTWWGRWRWGRTFSIGLPNNKIELFQWHWYPICNIKKFYTTKIWNIYFDKLCFMLVKKRSQTCYLVFNGQLGHKLNFLRPPFHLKSSKSVSSWSTKTTFQEGNILKSFLVLRGDIVSFINKMQKKVRF